MYIFSVHVRPSVHDCDGQEAKIYRNSFNRISRCSILNENSRSGKYFRYLLRVRAQNTHLTLEKIQKKNIYHTIFDLYNIFGRTERKKTTQIHSGESKKKIFEKILTYDLTALLTIGDSYYYCNYGGDEGERERERERLLICRRP